MIIVSIFETTRSRAQKQRAETLKTELAHVERTIQAARVYRRLTLVHLDQSEEGFYILGIELDARKLVVFADVEEFLNKRWPSIVIQALLPADQILAQFSVIPAESGDLDARAWRAIMQGATLQVSIPYPSASFAWPYDKAVADMAKQLLDD
jgi:hypothetical protein